MVDSLTDSLQIYQGASWCCWPDFNRHRGSAAGGGGLEAEVYTSGRGKQRP